MNEALIEDLAKLSYDPYAFVMWAYPWGETGELSESEGPNKWQTDLLCNVRDKVISLETAVQIAVTSGHGVGKSALVAWLLDWAQSTCEDTKGVVTANTENQLKTKTWVEFAKWHRLSLTRSLFKMTATARFSADPDHQTTWRIDMVPWSERNTESFAGLHNHGKRIIIVMDEASAIPDLIHEVTEGALTDKDTEILWFMFGNPTRNKGRFREAFDGGRFAHRWTKFKVDSREVPGTNKEQFARWIEDYGEDSDFVRVRVKGEFPRVDADSFIPLDMAREAARREPPPRDENTSPLVLGVDVARFGDDSSVIYPRQGRDAKSRPPRLYHNLSTLQLATKVFDAYVEFSATTIYVDEGGVGGGVVDRLVEMGLPVVPVQFGARADWTNQTDPGILYENKRAEIWGATRDWLRTGAICEEVGSDATLPEQLSSPTYSFNKRDHIVLQSKSDMRRLGHPSPDVADALALTFAYPANNIIESAQKAEVMADYDPFADERMSA